MSHVAAAPVAPRRRPQPPYNGAVTWLLESPLHRLLSGSVLLMRFRGHRTGVEHRIPVQYAVAGDQYVVLAGHPERKRWWRNFTSTRAVSLVVRGRDEFGTAAAVFAGDLDFDRLARAYVKRFPHAAAAAAADTAVFVRIEPLKL